ncbi:hypothetical protein BMS3Abin16_00949 [archaeon BMS3Abin16]|nr:hypothetical protein BMS3Abin16_00949 [archaeon BMS3Abin16]GBE55963.1 hypothetical protein BMS3Bbin16_00160 [archaeon BMS3Bbin16]HDY74476.1 hypothetical protein [Euryarchaeota archaeon]
MNNFQRKGSLSNAHVGRDFEKVAKEYFETLGLILKENLDLPVGIGNIKKNHAFDLGNSKQKVVVECKSHKWTKGDNVPSAKLTVWNEAMYYFLITPPDYRKIFFVLKDFSKKRNETLAEYYLRTYGHLIPSDVEIWEYNQTSNTADKLH